jgi:hypothetical protein
MFSNLIAYQAWRKFILFDVSYISHSTGLILQLWRFQDELGQLFGNSAAIAYNPTGASSTEER